MLLSFLENLFVIFFSRTCQSIFDSVVGFLLSFLVFGVPEVVGSRVGTREELLHIFFDGPVERLGEEGIVCE